MKRRSAALPYDPARQRLRELERIIKLRHGALADNSAERYLLPAARALLQIRRNKTGSASLSDLVDRLELWAGRGVHQQLLHAAAADAFARPRLEKADALALRLALTYDERQRLHVRTIGACDADKAERARRAKVRKRARDRARDTAKRRAAGARTREEFLANSLSRAQPWLAAGVSRRTWYRKQAKVGTGASPAGGTGPSPSLQQALGTSLPPDKSSMAEPATCATGDSGHARRTGNRRALSRPSQPLAEVAGVSRRLARAPHSAEASGPPIPQSPTTVRHMALLQRWGASPEQTVQLYVALLTAVGSKRHDAVDELFVMMERRHNRAGRKKLEWLARQVHLLAKHEFYRPQRQLPSAVRRRNREAVLDVMRNAANEQANIATIVERTGRSVNSVRNLVAWLVRDKEIVRVGPGLFRLAGNDDANKIYEPAAAAILRALADQPSMTTGRLVAVTGRSRSAIDAALFRLVDRGQVSRVGRGAFCVGKPGDAAHGEQASNGVSAAADQRRAVRRKV